MERCRIAIPRVLTGAITQSGKIDNWGRPITKRGSPNLRGLWLSANRARRYAQSLRAFYEWERAGDECRGIAATAVTGKLCHIVLR